MVLQRYRHNLLLASASLTSVLTNVTHDFCGSLGSHRSDHKPDICSPRPVLDHKLLEGGSTSYWSTV